MAQKKAPRLARDFVFVTKVRNHPIRTKSIDFKIKTHYNTINSSLIFVNALIPSREGFFSLLIKKE